MVEGALESGHHPAHYTVIGKILRRAARALGTKSLRGNRDGASEARHETASAVDSPAEASATE